MQVQELEKTSADQIPKNKKRNILPLPAELLIALLAGYLAAGTKLGGNGIPLCVSVASLFSFTGGIASFAGTLTSLLLYSSLDSAVTELAAIPAVIVFCSLAAAIKGERISPAAKGILSGTVYIICGTAAAFAFRISAAIVLAVVFRGAVCGTASYLAAKVISVSEKKTLFARGNRAALAAVFALALCMLCGVSFGTVNIGRAAGAFIALSAAYISGSGTGGTAAALTSFAAGMASASLLPSSPVLVCSALTAGMFRRKGRLPAAVSFLGMGLAGSLMLGMPPDTLKLLADMSAAAVLFCVLPDNCRRKAFMDIPAGYRQGSVPIVQYGEKLRFASLAIADIKDSFVKAVRIFDEKERPDKSSSVLSETAAEYLECTEKMLSDLGGAAEIFPFCDEELSGNINGTISAYGARNSHTALFSDKLGRVYIECFYEGMLNIKPAEAAAKLSAAADRELAPPEASCFCGTTRLCFHEQENFRAEIGIARANGREETSGDHGTVFKDGCGSMVVILSDGMGSGAKAAVESCMTVSVAARMIKAGLSAETAARLVNLLLMAKSSEESFSTFDMLTVDLFTGKAELVKLGAAQSFVKCGGTVRIVESRTTPLGIISSVDIDRRSFRLSDGDEAVIMSDGICEEVFPEIRELMLSTGVTAQECAERIIGAAERDKENNILRQDDKTVYVVRLHKI